MLGIGFKLRTNNSNVQYQSPQRQRRKEGSWPLLPAGFGKGIRDPLQGVLQARWDRGLDCSSGTRPRHGLRTRAGKETRRRLAGSGAGRPAGIRVGRASPGARHGPGEPARQAALRAGPAGGVWNWRPSPAAGPAAPLLARLGFSPETADFPGAALRRPTPPPSRPGVGMQAGAAGARTEEGGIGAASPWPPGTAGSGRGGWARLPCRTPTWRIGSQRPRA